MVELLYLAYLEVVSPLGHQQDAELLVVELCHPALDFVLARVLADVLGLNGSMRTDALTFSRKALIFTY